MQRDEQGLHGHRTIARPLDLLRPAFMLPQTTTTYNIQLFVVVQPVAVHVEIFWSEEVLQSEDAQHFWNLIINMVSEAEDMLLRDTDVACCL